KSVNYQQAEWQKGWVTAKCSDFGSFQAFVDTASPSLNSPELGYRSPAAKAFADGTQADSYREGNADTIDLSPSKRIVLYPKDNSGVKSFRAELDGEGLMFTNE